MAHIEHDAMWIKQGNEHVAFHDITDWDTAAVGDYIAKASDTSLKMVAAVVGGGSGGSGNPALVLTVGDESTALTTGAAKLTFRMPYAMTLTDVRASVTTAPTGAGITVDINEAGASILSTLLTIDDGEETSTTAATPAVISDSALADDAEITIDIDGVGSSVAGAGLKVYLIGTVAGGGGGGSGLTPPLSTDFTATNTGAETTISDTDDGLVIAVGTGGSGTQLRCLFKALPTAPYSIVWKQRITSEGASSDGAGLALRDSATGRIAAYGMQYTGPQFSAQKWTSVSAFSANYEATTSIMMEPWFKLEDDNTNLVFSVGLSKEGPWLPMHSVARTDWLAAADEVGFYVEDQNLTNYLLLIEHYEAS